MTHLRKHISTRHLLWVTHGTEKLAAPAQNRLGTVVQFSDAEQAFLKKHLKIELASIGSDVWISDYTNTMFKLFKPKWMGKYYLSCQIVDMTRPIATDIAYFYLHGTDQCHLTARIFQAGKTANLYKDGAPVPFTAPSDGVFFDTNTLVFKTQGGRFEPKKVKTFFGNATEALTQVTPHKDGYTLGIFDHTAILSVVYDRLGNRQLFVRKTDGQVAISKQTAACDIPVPVIEHTFTDLPHYAAPPMQITSRSKEEIKFHKTHLKGFDPTEFKLEELSLSGPGYQFLKHRSYDSTIGQSTTTTHITTEPDKASIDIFYTYIEGSNECHIATRCAQETGLMLVYHAGKSAAIRVDAGDILFDTQTFMHKKSEGIFEPFKMSLSSISKFGGDKSAVKEFLRDLKISVITQMNGRRKLGIRYGSGKVVTLAPRDWVGPQSKIGCGEWIHRYLGTGRFEKQWHMDGNFHYTCTDGRQGETCGHYIGLLENGILHGPGFLHNYYDKPNGSIQRTAKITFQIWDQGRLVLARPVTEAEEARLLKIPAEDLIQKEAPSVHLNPYIWIAPEGEVHQLNVTFDPVERSVLHKDFPESLAEFKFDMEGPGWRLYQAKGHFRPLVIDMKTIGIDQLFIPIPNVQNAYCLVGFARTRNAELTVYERGIAKTERYRAGQVVFSEDTVFRYSKTGALQCCAPTRRGVPQASQTVRILSPKSIYTKEEIAILAGPHIVAIIHDKEQRRKIVVHQNYFSSFNRNNETGYRRLREPELSHELSQRNPLDDDLEDFP